MVFKKINLIYTKMNHLTTYNQFQNEALFFSPYNEIVKKIYQRIKDTFDYENLIQHFSWNYEYTLEETASFSGNIKIKLINRSIPFNLDYRIEIDDEIVNCSQFLARRIFKFLDSKWKDKEKNLKKEADEKKLQDFKKKYDI
jgi:hypothetical protein